MKYSNSGESYCLRVRIGYYINGNYYSQCSGTDYNEVTSSCVTCSYKQCDQFTGITQVCPTGYYFSSSTTEACTICPTGYYCYDGVYRTQATSAHPAGKTQQIWGNVDCPAGYECNYYSISLNSAGYWSHAEQATATQ